ncbi:MAG: hypothetical protein IK134_08410 [Oscillospiraceae bacterium]|nr:hypothetical protein [Oscillospiraceae bacterium]
MKQKEIEILLAWFINEEFRLEDQMHELRQRIRFRRITLEDNIEMILLQQRIDDFQEFRLNCVRLLNLDNYLNCDLD